MKKSFRTIRIREAIGSSMNPSSLGQSWNRDFADPNRKGKDCPRWGEHKTRSLS
ncbi:MAG: hypothetical protein QNK38_02120 [Nitrospirota bacterium]|nr:hypothetical protein [Nitrospirota bacterium]MDX2419853.1 hypothetical protein [Nitrospirota bacterium]